MGACAGGDAGREEIGSSEKDPLDGCWFLTRESLSGASGKR